ncbi:MAG: DUF4304 domain-containing protein [Novosphingobium sp.]
MAGTHDKIIANAARSELVPLGFQRKGRSRTWTADHGWWLTVVEFQPSSWSKGSYLNVAAHWLWSPSDQISFDFGGRLEEHVEFASEMQFTQEAVRLAQGAAQEALRLSDLFISPSTAAEVLLTEERETNSHAWMAYHAGVMAGVAGFSADANEMFVRVSSGFAQPNSALAQAAKHMAALVEEPERFRDEANSLIVTHRAALRLPTLPNGPF